MIGSLLKLATGGGLKGILNPVKNVAEVFTPNAEAQDQRASAHNSELIKQYASEFRKLENRTWFDSFVDGMNRLIRPLMTIGFIGFVLILPPYDPLLFSEIVTAYDLVPDLFWGIVLAIVTFYFGKRTVEKVQERRINKERVDTVLGSMKEIQTMRKERSSPVNQTTQFDENGVMR